MCGICGELNFKKPVDYDVLNDMTSALTHRGPDDEGYFVKNISVWDTVDCQLLICHRMVVNRFGQRIILCALFLMERFIITKKYGPILWVEVIISKAPLIRR